MSRRLHLLVVVVAALAVPRVAAAHVKYVTPGGNRVDALSFLLRTLTDPTFLALAALGGVASLLAVGSYLRFRPVRHDIDAFRAALDDYRDLVPWLLRLSVGLPLVGAGFSGYFFSPTVAPAVPTFARLFGIGVGFLLLFGLATRLVATVGLVTYLGALAFDPTLLLAFEYVPGFLALVLVGSGRPSADGVVARLAADGRTYYSRIDPFYRSVAVPFAARFERFETFVPTLVRLGLGFAFAYLGVTQKLLAPGDSLAVVAKYDLTAVFPVDPALWVVGAGLVELVVGLALAFGFFTRAFSLVAFALFTTTLFGLPDDPVLAHVSLFGLVSVLLITGAGPLSLDHRLSTTDARRATSNTRPDRA